MPTVSVIIPTFNCAQFLPFAIDSVLKQTYPDFEMIIVDDGSTDNTPEIIKPYLVNHPSKIKYIWQPNKGLAIARNTAINNSTGEYIALLDADDAWLPDKLELQVKILNEKNETGLIHSNITYISEKGGILSSPPRNPQILSGNIFTDIFLRKENIACPTVLFKRKCINEVGLFDENLTRLGCEDRDLWLRILKRFNAIYIDKSLSYYRLRHGSMSKNIEKMYKARYYVIQKNFSNKNVSLIMKRKAIASCHREQGDEFLFKKEFIKARQEYYAGIISWPFSFWLIINFIKACLNWKIKNNYTS